MSDLDKRLEGLTPKQRELLLRRMKQKAAARAAETPAEGDETIPQLSREGRDRFPLSFSQLRQWILEQLEPGTAAYNLPAPLRFQGPLDVDSLERAIGEILRRHESLRTSFEDGDDEPVQVIHPPSDFELAKHDLGHLPADERLAEATRLAAEDGATPFDLSVAPLVRFELLRLDDEDHVLLFTFHHIVSDGWSRGVFFRELETLYHAYRQGEEPELPELSIQYADFAAWQRDRLSGDVLEKHIDFWRQSLKPNPPTLELPTDRPRPKVAGSEGAEVRRPLSNETVARLRELSRSENATLFMTFMTAFKVFLYRHTHQRDLAVGTFIANRNRDQISDLIGFFVNTLVLRSAIDPAATFLDNLRAERDIAFDAFAHQDLPFEKIVEELQPERSTSSTPFFQTMLVVQNARRRELGLEELQMSYLGKAGDHANFDLTLWAWESDESISLVLEYRTDLFDPSTAETFLDRFVRLVEAVVENPDRPAEALPTSSDEEQRRLLHDLGTTPAKAASDRPIHELIAEQAARTPDAVALEFGDERLTYAETMAEAHRLARHLRSLGVGAETLVGISLPRSLQQVTTLLAVLESGGAYLPLDPEYPSDRLLHMLEDSDAQVLVTRADLEGSLPSEDELPASLRRVLLDGDAEAIAAHDATAPEVAIDPEQVAYVIYTSGSTGKPKGVLVPHRCLAHYVLDAADAYGLVDSDRALQFASVNFDTSAEEIYPALLRGATLVLRDDEMMASVATFVERIDALGITLLNLPTAFWHQICGELDSVTLPAGLRRVIIGGEKASVAHLGQWQRRASESIELVNTYGPTEATIVTTRCELVGDGAPDAATLAEAGREVPLGLPLTGARAVLLDPGQNPVPEGVIGELAIGGAGVVRGYHGRPAKTAEVFVPDPFSGESGARLYRSGDLAVWREGLLEFRGRTDHQVKVRGFRVELGEIESVLGQQEGVRDAVVDARQAGDDLRLVAYVVPTEENPEKRPEVSALKDGLRQRLPEYMVPAAFVFLDQLPTSPSGKVDRRSLPDPASVGIEREKEYVPPTTTTETLLAEIWQDALQVDQVGLHDDFFDLGGHSLLATKLVARVRQVFQAELPLLTIFDHSGLEAMAREIDRLENVDDAPLPPLVRLERPTDGPPTFPLSFPQERIWVLNELQGDNLAYHFVFILNLEGPLDSDILQRSLDELIRRHEILRTTFHQQDGKPIQVVHPMPVRATFREVDLRDIPNKNERLRRATEMVSEAGREHFDVRELPLARWLLIRVDEEHYMMGQIEHHFMHDGWSVSILLREIQEIYEAFAEGRPSPLPELEVQFGDFAHWQQQLLQGAYYDKLRDYWIDKVADAHHVIELPGDFARPRVNRFEGDLIPIALPDELYDRLHRFNLEHHTSLYITMLATFYVFLYRYTGQDNALIGAMLANRRMKEAEALVGMIVNTILLRGDMSPDLTFHEMLAQVRQTVLDAHAHQDMPFEKLVGELNPRRELSRNPLFQIMFAFHDSAVPDVQFCGIKGTLQGAHNHSAKADLNIVVIPKAEQRASIERKVEKEEADKLIMYWEYNVDLFEKATIERMIEHYRLLLEAFVENPELKIAEAPMMTAEEHDRLLVEWNDTTTEFADGPFAEPFAEGSTLHELVARRAESTPDAVAVVARGADGKEERLTYAELTARVHRLANHLVEAGLEPEQYVGVCVDRSAHLPVALLAVVEAGGAYLPIDPAFPADRIGFMLEDAAAPIVITLESLEANLGEHDATGSRTTIRLDADADAIAARSAEAPARKVDADQLAYVIYTSGSTGKPKGVAVPHRTVVNFLASMAEEPGFGADDVLVAVTTISFDIAGLELYLPLTTGGRVVIADKDTAVDGEELMRLVAESGATAVQATPATWQMLFAAGWTGDESLKVLCGGEALPPALGEKLRESCGEVWNLYGPTEATIWSTARRVSEGDFGYTSVPIGRPIANTRVYLVDETFRPVATGVPGELWIGGEGVARGYHGRAALTAERFVPDPFAGSEGAGEAGGRLYRTGDLARWRADGTLSFVGRIDHQVKVRGYRIELGEIEAVLDRHESVDRSVVIVREDVGDQPILVAYMTPADAENRPDGDALREHLRAQLPDYMVPGVFLVLDELPLTPNKKVDRKALPTPDRALAAEREYVAPRTPLEEELAAMWQEMLKAERVGVDDTFFELGGHSLLATQVISRLAASHGVRLALAKFFDTPTVAGLAAEIEAARERGDSAETKITRADDADDLVAQAEGLGEDDLDALLGQMMEDDA